MPPGPPTPTPRNPPGPGLARRLLRHAPLLAVGLLGCWAGALAWPAPRAWGLLGAAAGALLNAIVIALNGGFMPYAARPDDAPEPPESHYRPIDARTRARWLSDWIDIGSHYVSPGDIVIVLGLLGWILTSLWGAYAP